MVSLPVLVFAGAFGFAQAMCPALGGWWVHDLHGPVESVMVIEADVEVVRSFGEERVEKLERRPVEYVEFDEKGRVLLWDEFREDAVGVLDSWRLLVDRDDLVEELNYLLDIIESSSCSLPPQATYTFNQLKTELEANLGCDHPAVLQLRAVLHATN